MTSRLRIAMLAAACTLTFLSAGTPASGSNASGPLAGGNFNASLGSIYFSQPGMNQRLSSLGFGGVGDFGVLGDLGFSVFQKNWNVGLSLAFGGTILPETSGSSWRFASSRVTERLEVGYCLGNPKSVLIVPMLTFGFTSGSWQFSTNMDWAAYLLNPAAGGIHEFKRNDTHLGAGVDLYVQASRNPRFTFGGFILKLRYDYTILSTFQQNLQNPPPFDRHAVSLSIGSFVGTVGRQYQKEKDISISSNRAP